MEPCVIAALRLLDAWFQARRNFRGLRGDALVAHQDRLAREMVTFAVAHSPFYRRHFAGHDLTRWRELPKLAKPLMMAEFSDVNTRGITRAEAIETALRAEQTRDFRPTVRGITVGLSSGTSGHRSLFIASREEQARWVGTVLARLLPPFRLRGYTITLFALSGSNLYDDMRGRWIRFHYHDVATRVDEAVRMLNVEQPDILVATPTYLRALGERRLAGDLRIHPRRVLSAADVLDPDVEVFLARAFGCPVGQIYQCSEGLVALSCPHGRLHVQEDVLVAQLEPLPEPAVGDVMRYTPVITDLGHRTQPIIRYQLGDVVTLDAADACACGSAFKVLASVEGRRDDVCEFIDGTGNLHPVFPGTIRRMVLLASDDIIDFDAVQERPSHLRVRVEPAPGADAERVAGLVHSSILAGLTAQGMPNADVQVSAESVPRVGLKRRRIRRTVSPPGTAT